ncbi:hypothetical protein EDC30_102206 [Paucimonas lemoignei]|uniref:Acb2/Tad1 hairpin domain-containing protein n=1 Tax=Paucimonas lemoignei TaxID=29443 RepID=A0A4R3HYM1_PAULE|nr:hypothetical protein [Paucimonas lemoignei]TCS38467.1 hypothetical protein EDC30_102206 [Paucimonas lemoignei]
MDNQHRKIAGYRELSQEDIDLMNEIKEHGEKTRLLVDKVKMVESARPAVMGDREEFDTALESGRWIGIAKTHLQQGFMALTRAVAKPKGF